MDTSNYGLTPKGYRERLIEDRLDILLRSFGCVEIRGAKWCGKTWTALSRAASVTKLDSLSERQVAEVDPMLALVGDTPHLIDEWQEVPQVWGACRRAVDDSGNKRGLYLLTGSVALRKNERNDVHHTGTGRIARIVMRPMTLFEMGYSSGFISLRDLFNGKKLPSLKSKSTVADIARWCCRGGWPANIDVDDDIAFETPVQYLKSALDINVVNDGKSVSLAESFLRALAMNEGQAVTYKTLLKDGNGGQLNTSNETITSYLELFNSLYLIENLSGWEPPMRAKSRVRVKPKRYFVDPSLASALLGTNPSRLLSDMQTLGVLFENLVHRDLQVFCSSYSGIGNTLSYYRDDKGLEVDFIVEFDGKWAGIEVKLSDTKIDSAAKSLCSLRKKMSENPAAQNANPAFLAIIVGKGSVSYTREDGIHVIPVSLLGA